MPRTQAARRLVLDTPLGDDALLIQTLRFTEELGRPFQIDLKLVAEARLIKGADIIGQGVTITLDIDEAGTKQRYFNGFVARFALAGQSGNLPQYQMTVVPFLWLLGRTSDCRTFQTVGVPDIAKQTIKDKGFSDIDDRLSGSFPRREFCVQYRETAFNFVSRLMEEEGIYYFFDQENGKHTMVLANDPSAHATLGTKYYEKMTKDFALRDPDAITDWQYGFEVSSGAFALTDYDFTNPRKQMKSNSTAPVGGQHADGERFDYPGGYVEPSDGERLSRIRLEESQVRYELANGVTGSRDFAAGKTFTLSDHTDTAQNKEWLITSVAIDAANPQYTSGNGQMPADTEGGFTCRFTAIPAGTVYRPAQSTTVPVVIGPQPAVVVGSAGEEIETDKYGRIKVHFLWDRHDQSDEHSSCWVRVAQPWAGKNWGHLFIPRIGMEVVVEFVNGDPDYPLVTGCVYNGDNMPPYDLPANKTQSGVKTRSSKGGAVANCNEIRFEDKMGGEMLTFHAEKDQTIEVENDESHWVGHDRSKKVDHDETVKIGNNRTESVTANEQISIGKSRTETVGQDEMISISGGRTETVGKDESISISGNRTTDIAKGETVSVAEDRTETVNKNEQVTIQKSRTVNIGENDQLSVGKTLAVIATNQIQFQTGDASILMKSDGTIEITGNNVTINGSGKITVKASSDVIVKGSTVKTN